MKTEMPNPESHTLTSSSPICANEHCRGALDQRLLRLPTSWIQKFSLHRNRNDQKRARAWPVLYFCTASQDNAHITNVAILETRGAKNACWWIILKQIFYAQKGNPVPKTSQTPRNWSTSKRLTAGSKGQQYKDIQGAGNILESGPQMGGKGALCGLYKDYAE